MSCVEYAPLSSLLNTPQLLLVFIDALITNFQASSSIYEAAGFVITYERAVEESVEESGKQL